MKEELEEIIEEEKPQEKGRVYQVDIPTAEIKSRHIQESVELTTPTLITPTLTTPVIDDFTSAPHDHSSASEAGGIIRVVSIIIFDDETEITTGDGAGDVFYRIPVDLNGWDLIGVAAQVQTAATGSGSETTDIQIHNVTDSVDILSTKLTIDEDEIDSSTAAAAVVIDTTKDDVAVADQLRFDIDAVPSTTGGNGLLIEMRFELP